MAQATITEQGLPPQLPNIVWYDFHAMPKYVAGQNINHAYYYMTGANYVRVAERDDLTHEDIYHQDDSGAWCGEAETTYDNPCLGGGDEILDAYIYIAIHGYFNLGEERSSGFFTMTWLPYAEVQIPGPQLQFLYDLYNNNCYPTQKDTPIFDPFDVGTSSSPLLNKHWNRGDYMSGYYVTGSAHDKRSNTAHP